MSLWQKIADKFVEMLDWNIMGPFVTPFSRNYDSLDTDPNDGQSSSRANPPV